MDVRQCVRHYVRTCFCVSRVCITVFSPRRHQRNRISSVAGRLAQLVERTLSMREVEGSKPSLSTTFLFFYFFIFYFFILFSFSFLFLFLFIFHFHYTIFILTLHQNKGPGPHLFLFLFHFDHIPNSTSAQRLTLHAPHIIEYQSHHLVSLNVI